MRGAGVAACHCMHALRRFRRRDHASIPAIQHRTPVRPGRWLCYAGFAGLLVSAAATSARADIPGACCFPDGSCDVYVNWVACEDDGGTFAGYGVTCDNAGCEPTEPECDTPLSLSACPQTIVVETSSADGAEFDLPNPPVAEGCEPIVTIDPPIGSILPIGDNTIVVTATDTRGDEVSCEFVVEVDYVDEDGPIRKRRIKGGGNVSGGDATSVGACGELSPFAQSLIGSPACGACQFVGFFGFFAGMAACRRSCRKCRKSRTIRTR